MWSGLLVQLAIIIAPRVRGGIPVLRFSALHISIAGFWPSMVHSLVPEMTRKSLRTILIFISFEQDGIKMCCGIIKLQKAESSRIAVHI